MLDLIYAGQQGEAENLLDYSWAEDDTTRKVFEDIFWKKVKSSYYWEALQKSNW